jgi:hypothetical protein
MWQIPEVVTRKRKKNPSNPIGSKAPPVPALPPAPAQRRPQGRSQAGVAELCQGAAELSRSTRSTVYGTALRPPALLNPAATAAPQRPERRCAAARTAARPREGCGWAGGQFPAGCPKPIAALRARDLPRENPMGTKSQCADVRMCGLVTSSGICHNFGRPRFNWQVIEIASARAGRAAGAVERAGAWLLAGAGHR